MNQSALQYNTRALLTVLRFRNLETSSHVSRVTRLALCLGAVLKLSPDESNTLKFAALLHDVGKVFTLDYVLNKRGAFTTDETTHMREHVVRGSKLLTQLKFPSGVIKIVRQHHERWDGEGYPHKLSGEDICIGARIFTVVDAFDAIISNRCYRNGNTYQAAADEITRCSGTQFDPDVVTAFLCIPLADWERAVRRKLVREQFLSGQTPTLNTQQPERSRERER